MKENVNTNHRQTIHPSKIAQFYNLNQCPAYLAHEYTDVFSPPAIDDVPLSPLLQATGEKHEANQLEALLAARVQAIGPADHEIAEQFDEHWSGDISEDMSHAHDLVETILGDDDAKPLVFHQMPIREQIGVWPVEGDADIVIVEPREWGADVRIVEIKSSSEALTHHKLQVATYSLSIKELFSNLDYVQINASVTSQNINLASIVTATGEIDTEKLPRVDLRPLENDIELLLEEGGSIDQTLRDLDQLPPHQLNASCEGCPHQTKCLAHDIVNQDLALLQLPESTQLAFQEHGVTSLADVADLYEFPTERRERTPVNYDTLEPADPQLLSDLQDATDRSDFSDLAQIAHRFRRELEPDYEAEWQQRQTGKNAGPWPMWLIGSGTNLPEDDPRDDSWDTEWDKYPKRSLVRVYPTVVYDHIRNRVAYLGAVVTSSRHEDAGGEPKFVVARPEELPESEEAKDTEEQRLLETFFEQLADAVAMVAPDLSAEGSDYTADDGYIHMYFWSEHQRDTLVDAVKRHPDAEGSPTLRKLLGLRKEIDQEAVSTLTADIRKRQALRYPGLGLVQTVAQFYSRDSDFSWDQLWSDDTHGIKEVFDDGLFKTAVEFQDIGGRIIPSFEDGFTIPNDHYQANVYPALERNRDTLPLEYVWACSELDRLKPSDVDDEDARERVQNYRHYSGEGSPRISLDDIDILIETICRAIQHVERSISYKDCRTPKETITVGNLRNEAFEETALQRACIEYQQLDHGIKRDRLISQYRQPLQQRIVDGNAVAFECSRTPKENERFIRGDVLRSFGNGNASPLSISIGDWVVVTPLREANGRLSEKPKKPKYYANSTLAVVDRVDNDTISLYSIWDSGQWPRSTDPNMTWHFGWTPSKEEAENADFFASQNGRDYDTTLVQRGEKFVVDPAIDDYSAYRARKALENASQNVVHNRLVSVYDDHDPTALQETLYSNELINEFLDGFDSVMPEQTNTKQADFVREVDHTITALQGPPGTGKTSMASAPAILSRAYAHGDGFNGLCTAHSNTAVDEIVEDVAEAVRRLETEGILTDLSLIRVRSTSSYRQAPANVEDLHYRDDCDELLELFNEGLNDESRVIVFATPVTIRNALNQVVLEQSEQYDSVEGMMAEGDSKLFDATLVDEASMMDLPVLFLIGAFLRDSGQLMLVGDHRQMQPIQAHDWEQEDRQTIEENTPALSVLDFVRFLRGDVGSDLSYLERTPPDWRDPDAVLPMTRLKVTYRLPQSVADLATDLFYSQDDISLESGVENPTIPDVRDTLDAEWLKAALKPDSRVTLLVHDENQSKSESPFEATLTRQVVDALQTMDPGKTTSPQSVTAGVVVPFRLQRRRLRKELARNVQVDTVEKFQGGERGLIVLSMTAGNQGYINSLTDFLLDPNRFNVGASRMRQKLVIIASKAIFRAGSTNATEYSEQKSWKLLYNELVRGRSPDASATFDSSDIPELDNQSVELSVYNGFADSDH